MRCKRLFAVRHWQLSVAAVIYRVGQRVHTGTTLNKSYRQRPIDERQE